MKGVLKKGGCLAVLGLFLVLAGPGMSQAASLSSSVSSYIQRKIVPILPRPTTAVNSLSGYVYVNGKTTSGTVSVDGKSTSFTNGTYYVSGITNLPRSGVAATFVYDIPTATPLRVGATPSRGTKTVYLNLVAGANTYTLTITSNAPTPTPTPTPTPAPTPTAGSFSGTVRQNGQVVGNAAVSYKTTTGVTGSMLSGADGRYTFQNVAIPVSLTLTCSKNGFTTSYTVAINAGANTAVDCSLPATATIQGIISVDGIGVVKNATVSFATTNGAKKGQNITATTNDAGSYSITGMEVGSQGTLSIQHDLGQPYTENLTLSNGGSITVAPGISNVSPVLVARSIVLKGHEANKLNVQVTNTAANPAKIQCATLKKANGDVVGSACNKSSGASFSLPVLQSSQLTSDTYTVSVSTPASPKPCSAASATVAFTQSFDQTKSVTVSSACVAKSATDFTLFLFVSEKYLSAGGNEVANQWSDIDAVVSGAKATIQRITELQSGIQIEDYSCPTVSDSTGKIACIVPARLFVANSQYTIRVKRDGYIREAVIDWDPTADTGMQNSAFKFVSLFKQLPASVTVCDNHGTAVLGQLWYCDQHAKELFKADLAGTPGQSLQTLVSSTVGELRGKYPAKQPTTPPEVSVDDYITPGAAGTANASKIVGCWPQITLSTPKDEPYISLNSKLAKSVAMRAVIVHEWGHMKDLKEQGCGQFNNPNQTLVKLYNELVLTDNAAFTVLSKYNYNGSTTNMYAATNVLEMYADAFATNYLYPDELKRRIAAWPNQNTQTILNKVVAIVSQQ